MGAIRLFLAALALAAASACGQTREPVTPALWEVTAPDGKQGWLFGTIHALPRPVDWRSPAIDAALAKAERIVVEIGTRGDPAERQRIFTELAETPGQPPLRERVPPELRGRLAELLDRAGLAEAQFAKTETWAAALTLARAGAADVDSANGIDGEVEGLAEGRPVIELEGARGQLRLFDTLPEREQRDLLAAVVADPRAGTESPAEAWRRGDMAAIERETHRGLLADPELREVLFAARNRAWARLIQAMILSGQRPFVAVGGAHMASEEGLPALLTARGFTVRRVQ
jgi:uncharacterized protein YbaP (TraB family)